MRWILAGAVALLVAGIATVVAATSQTVETEVRIVAAQQEDGRIAFALQQRQEDDTWGERIRPAQHMFPAAADAPVGRWLSSSPVTVAVEVDIPEPDPPAPAEEPPTAEGFGAWEAFPEDVYAVRDDDRAGALMLACGSGSGSQMAAVLTDEYLLNDRGTDRIAVAYWYEDGGELQAEFWHSDEDSDPDSWLDSTVSPRPLSSGAQAFATWLVSHYTPGAPFIFTVTDWYGDSYTGWFTLTGLHAVLDALPCFTD